MKKPLIIRGKRKNKEKKKKEKNHGSVGGRLGIGYSGAGQDGGERNSNRKLIHIE